MNHQTKPKRFVRIPKIDGVAVRIPVSDFVLNLKKNPQVLGARIKNTSFAQRSSAFVFTIVLCAASFGVTHANPIDTLSYFRDKEVSRANLFAAGFLGFRLNPGDVTIPITEGGEANLSPLFAPLPDTFAIKYRVRAEIVGDETPLCALLQASGTSTPYLYSGALKDLVTEPATTTGHGNLSVTLPSATDVPDGTQCTIALVYRGWFVDAPENTGYTDQKKDTFTFVYSAPAPMLTTQEEVPPSTNVEQPLEIAPESTTTSNDIDTPQTLQPDSLPDEPAGDTSSTDTQTSL